MAAYKDMLLWQKNKCQPRGNEGKHSEHLRSTQTLRTVADQQQRNDRSAKAIAAFLDMPEYFAVEVVRELLADLLGSTSLCARPRRSRFQPQQTTGF